MTTDLRDIFEDLHKIRSQKPIIHNITNQVASPFSANVLLAVGASPLMAHEPSEMEDISKIANALVLNIGTADLAQIESMQVAIRFAREKKIPVLIDPVGAGASRFRTESAKELLKQGQNCILKGNASEILALADLPMDSKGVDSDHVDFNKLDRASFKLFEEFKISSIVITGKTDYIISKSEISEIHFGSEMMTKVTAMGCSLASTIAAFCAVQENTHLACKHAASYFGKSGEITGKISKGPGTFANLFIDTLYNFEDLIGS